MDYELSRKAFTMIRFLPILGALLLCVSSCTSPIAEEVNQLKIENDSLKTILKKNAMKKQMYRFLTFQDNNAENAMNFYVEIFDNSKVISLQRWPQGAPGEEGKIMQAIFDLDGNLFMCSDSPAIHDWDFSPAISNFIECDSEAEIEKLFSKLSENGNVTMPLNNYGFSQKFGWVIDQYGVSWQLNLK